MYQRQLSGGSAHRTASGRKAPPARPPPMVWNNVVPLAPGGAAGNPPSGGAHDEGVAGHLRGGVAVSVDQHGSSWASTHRAPSYRPGAEEHAGPLNSARPPHSSRESSPHVVYATSDMYANRPPPIHVSKSAESLYHPTTSNMSQRDANPYTTVGAHTYGPISVPTSRATGRTDSLSRSDAVGSASQRASSTSPGRLPMRALQKAEERRRNGGKSPAPSAPRSRANSQSPSTSVQRQAPTPATSSDPRGLVVTSESNSNHRSPNVPGVDTPPPQSTPVAVKDSPFVSSKSFLGSSEVVRVNSTHSSSTAPPPLRQDGGSNLAAAVYSASTSTALPPQQETPPSNRRNLGDVDAARLAASATHPPAPTNSPSSRIHNNSFDNRQHLADYLQEQHLTHSLLLNSSELLEPAGTPMTLPVEHPSNARRIAVDDSESTGPMNTPALLSAQSPFVVQDARCGSSGSNAAPATPANTPTTLPADPRRVSNARQPVRGGTSPLLEPATPPASPAVLSSIPQGASFEGSVSQSFCAAPPGTPRQLSVVHHVPIYSGKEGTEAPASPPSSPAWGLSKRGSHPTVHQQPSSSSLGFDQSVNQNQGPATPPSSPAWGVSHGNRADEDEGFATSSSFAGYPPDPPSTPAQLSSQVPGRFRNSVHSELDRGATLSPASTPITMRPLDPLPNRTSSVAASSVPANTPENSFATNPLHTRYSNVSMSASQGQEDLGSPTTPANTPATLRPTSSFTDGGPTAVPSHNHNANQVVREELSISENDIDDEDARHGNQTPMQPLRMPDSAIRKRHSLQQQHHQSAPPSMAPSPVATSRTAPLHASANRALLTMSTLLARESRTKCLSRFYHKWSRFHRRERSTYVSKSSVSSLTAARILSSTHAGAHRSPSPLESIVTDLALRPTEPLPNSIATSARPPLGRRLSDTPDRLSSSVSAHASADPTVFHQPPPPPQPHLYHMPSSPSANSDGRPKPIVAALSPKDYLKRRQQGIRTETAADEQSAAEVYSSQIHNQSNLSPIAALRQAHDSSSLSQFATVGGPLFAETPSRRSTSIPESGPPPLPLQSPGAITRFDVYANDMCTSAAGASRSASVISGGVQRVQSFENPFANPDDVVKAAPPSGREDYTSMLRQYASASYNPERAQLELSMKSAADEIADRIRAQARQISEGYLSSPERLREMREIRHRLISGRKVDERAPSSDAVQHASLATDAIPTPTQYSRTASLRRQHQLNESSSLPTSRSNSQQAR